VERVDHHKCGRHGRRRQSLRPHSIVADGHRGAIRKSWAVYAGCLLHGLESRWLFCLPGGHLGRRLRHLRGSFGFVIFSGTSASAPGMAGVAALLDQKLGSAQGNLNPQIYASAAAAPASYHDTTVASSGVGSCSATTASLCNNSVANLTGGGAQAGFTVGTGYDLATGLGSLDVAAFLNNYNRYVKVDALCHRHSNTVHHHRSAIPVSYRRCRWWQRQPNSDWLSNSQQRYIHFYGNRTRRGQRIH